MLGETPESTGGRRKSRRNTKSSIGSSKSILSPVREEFGDDGGSTPPQSPSSSKSQSRRRMEEEEEEGTPTINPPNMSPQSLTPFMDDFGGEEEEDPFDVGESPIPPSSLKTKQSPSSAARRRGRNVGFDSHEEEEEEGSGDERRVSMVSVMSEDMGYVEGRREIDDTFMQSEEEEEENENDDMDTSGLDHSADASFIAGLDKVSLEEEEEGVRRSRRVTKGQRLAHWKNERFVYDGGEIVGTLIAPPTPHASTSKSKKATRKLKKKNKKKKRRMSEEEEEESKGVVRYGGEEIELSEAEMTLVREMRTKKKKLAKNLLPSSRDYSSSSSFRVWDASSNDTIDMKLAHFDSKMGKRRRESMREELDSTDMTPSTKKQRSTNNKVVFHPFFQVPSVTEIFSGFKSGVMVIPPNCVKNPQSNLNSSHIFHVTQAQKETLEVWKLVF